MKSMRWSPGLIFCLSLSFALSAAAQSASPLPPRWSPLGPSLISGAPTATGRANAVEYNPMNPFGEIWVGSATGGVWRGSILFSALWEPMTDDAATLAVGDIELDGCTPQRCASVWAGTGENGIRRDTQYGRGVLKGTWNGTLGRYEWDLRGQEHFDRGSIARLVLDPRTPDGPNKTVLVALSSGVTSNATHSTVTTEPPGPYGIWRSRDAGRTWSNLFPTETPATDLEMDPQRPDTLYAGVRWDGLYKSTDGGATWQPIGNGIPWQHLQSADWPEIEVFRRPGMSQAILYTVLADCPHPHDKEPILKVVSCAPFIYRSNDSGVSWTEVWPAGNTFPRENADFIRIRTHGSYTHALTVHPSNPNRVWYGGIGLYQSSDGGRTFLRTGGRTLHVDYHQVEVLEAPFSATGVFIFAVSDGGFFWGNGSFWTGLAQRGLAITQFQSISSSPYADYLIGGTQDNGTLLFQGSDVWERIDGGDAASTEIDLDDPRILYDVYVGIAPRRCSPPYFNFCAPAWPEIRTGIANNEHVSWYPPLIQDPTGAGGQHPLYFATHHLYRSLNDGETWDLVTQGDPPGGTGKIAELNDVQNPISAVAVAPTNRNRVYIGYYDGQVFTTDNAWAPIPRWTKIVAGLPAGRPVTSIAVHPLDERHVLLALSDFGRNSLFATTSAGASWSAMDASADGSLATDPVNSLLIEPRYPYRTWAGTDNGVWVRSNPNPGGEVWERSPGIPNVAVYDLQMDGDGASILAGSHGRGIWRYSGTPLARALAADAADNAVPAGASARALTVSAAGFDPGESCTMSLLEGDRVCSTSGTDADGAALATDERGFLVASRAGVHGDRTLAWVCRGGDCAGGTSSGQCDIREVRVTCGGRTARAAVKRSGEVLGPQSTELGFEPKSEGGTFTMAAKLRKGEGPSVELCSQSVSYPAGESEAAALVRAADSFNTSAGCRQAGVRAVTAGREEPGTREDEEPVPFRVSLEAPSQAGVQLVTELTFSGTGTFTVNSYGAPAHGRVVTPQVTVAGNAAGGRVEVTERSLVGTCSFAVETAAGEPAEAIAARIEEAFLAPEAQVDAPGTGAVCPLGQNPRDVERSGAALRFAVGRQVTVTSTDAGLGFTIGSDR